MEPFIGEIRAFGFGLIPRGWAQCDGRTLPIQQNAALFALLGTTYGGDGVRTFQIPDLRGRVCVGQGSGLDNQDYPMGRGAGQESVALTADQIPPHIHQLSCVSATGTSNDATGALPASSPATTSAYAASASAGAMAASALAPSGTSAAHNNMQPSLAVNYCIALTGIFPTRS